MDNEKVPHSQGEKIARILALSEHMATDIAEVKAITKENSDKLQRHEVAIARLCEWKEAIQPTVANMDTQVGDLRVELAKYGTLGGAIGVGFGIVFAIIQMVT